MNRTKNCAELYKTNALALAKSHPKQAIAIKVIIINTHQSSPSMSNIKKENIKVRQMPSHFQNAILFWRLPSTNPNPQCMQKNANNFCLNI